MVTVPVPAASLEGLTARAQQMQLLASEIGPQLHGIAIAGSMLEGVHPDLTEFVTDWQRPAEAGVREFGNLALQHGRDLRTALGEHDDLTLAQVWPGETQFPDNVAEFVERNLVGLAAKALSEHGELLSAWEFENPDWARFMAAAHQVIKLAPIAVAGVTIVLVATGGAAAVGLAPLILAEAATTIVVYVADRVAK